MSIRTRRPWMTLLLAATLVLSPIGRDVIGDAFLSGEQLSRNIAQPIALIAIAILATLVLLEWAVRSLVLKHRENGTQSARIE
jgi:hypothetical protein